MKKREFYIYQEDLVRYRTKRNCVTISQLVGNLNENYCVENMLKLRTETITNYLKKQGYLSVDENNKKRPTLKGRVLGITVGSSTAKNGDRYDVNLYNEKAQQYVVDNLYNILLKS